MPRRKPTAKPRPPEQPESRDEGPRFVPLADEEDKLDTEKLSHYMRLADLALAHPLEEEKD